MIVRDGVEYLTGREINERWADVTPARLRAWCQPGPAGKPPRLRQVTRAELAAALGWPAPAVDPDGPVRVPGQSGPENLYRWHEADDAEWATRTSGRGAPRGRRAA